MFLKLEIRANEGYCATDVMHRCLTVGELRDMLEGVDDDVRIVTLDCNNPRGAKYGTACDIYECYDNEREDKDDDDDEE